MGCGTVLDCPITTACCYCRRLGQTRPVTVYRLVTRGTVDQNILDIANRKLALDAAVLNGVTVAAKGGKKKGTTEGDTEGQAMGAILAQLLTTTTTTAAVAAAAASGPPEDC